MARKKPASKGNAKRQIDRVSVAYDLFDLPTAQHKAGLAGLTLQIQSMTDRKLPPEQIPVVESLTATSAVIGFTESSVQGLFDDLYDAEVVRVPVKTKWKGQEPVEVITITEDDPKTGEPKASTRYVYEVVQGCGHFLSQHLPDRNELWLKLWRDMIWNIPRGRPTTRRPFQQRAAKDPCSEGSEVWRGLVAFQEAMGKGVARTCEVASALLLGAQAANAESVPFRGRIEQTLLLHFWPLTVLVFVPQAVDNDGDSEFAGYSLAIPEVADLQEFCRIYPRVLHELSSDRRGFRPAGAVIDIPQQAGLEFLGSLARLTERATSRKQIRDVVSSVEYMHLVKAGNNVKSMAAGRISANPRVLDQYLALVGRGAPRFRNPLFRAGMMLWMLDEGEAPGRTAWYQPMVRMMAERPWPFFIRCEKTPKSMPWFAADARTRFEDVLNRYQNELEDSAMGEAQQPVATVEKPKPPLEVLVYRLVQNYVRQKTKDKSGLEWNDFKDRTVTDEQTGKTRVNVPAEYIEAREKVVSDAFLAMRSRREKDFVEYFTASICSVRRYLSEEDFCIVAEALLEKPDDVKALTLLALSANS